MATTMIASTNLTVGTPVPTTTTTDKCTLTVQIPVSVDESSMRRSSRKKTPNGKFIDTSEEGVDTPSTAASTPSPTDTSATSPTFAFPESSNNKEKGGEYYAIRKGNNVSHCIFSSWEHAKNFVEGFPGAVYNVFDNLEDATLYIQVAAPAADSSDSNKKRKRTATLPFADIINDSKKARQSVGATAIDRPAVRRVSNASTAGYVADNKENMVVPTVVSTPNKQHSLLQAAEEPEEDSRELPFILLDGYKNGRPKGWRANDLFPERRQDRFKWEERYLQDVSQLKSYRATKPTSARDVHNMKHTSGIPNAFSLAYLNWSWGVGEAYHRYLSFQQRKVRPEGKKLRTTKNNKLKVAPANKSGHYSCNTCVITNREAARKRFSARAMFYSFRVQELAEAKAMGRPKQLVPTRPRDFSDSMQNRSPLVNGCSRSKELMDEARADWEVLSDEDKLFWEQEEKKHDARQPEIVKILEKALARDPKRSAKKLSEDIGFWCGKTTIGKWKNLRIGPSYRKGIQEPLSRKDQREHMRATTDAVTNGLGDDNTNVSTLSAPPSGISTLLAAVSETNYYRTGGGDVGKKVGTTFLDLTQPATDENVVSSASSLSTAAEMEASMDDENLVI